MLSCEKPLKILSASAGSGKTYNLVLTFLKLVLNEEEHTDVFKTIIAMTFTNKAASEMKTRIIKALNQLSAGNPTENEAKFQQEIEREIKLPLQKIKIRANAVLKQILHQYENFNVLTIDKFNLRLIRSFSRDLNINNDFQTSTKQDQILHELIDKLFDEINASDKQELTQIALKFSQENIEDENKWEVKSGLKEIAKILLQEQNFPLIQKILNQSFNIKRYDELNSSLRKIKAEIHQKAQELHTVFFKYDTEKIPGKSTTVKAFEKLKNLDLKEKLNPTFFSSSTLKYFEENPKNGEGFSDEVKQKGLEFVDFFEKNFETYKKLDLFKKNYFNIALLKLIAVELENYKKINNTVLISEFNKMISDLLKEENAAYIYERIGNRYKHYLLDEFQDTSYLQWSNLVPLIHDSLGNGNHNLIVGDAKQSIYRFKNGLAEQFVSLPAIYNPEKNDATRRISSFFTELGVKLPLEDNWRSKVEIVEFNNTFFELFRSENDELMREFYTDIRQNPKGKTGGFVYFESEKIPKKDKANEEEFEVEEELSFLLKWIEDCKSFGYEYGDICILGYLKKECNSWANFLTANNLSVVSVDSLLLGADRQVKLVIAYIKWRMNVVGDSEARQFAELYFDLTATNAIEGFKKYWKKVIRNEKEYLEFDATDFLKNEFGGEEEFFFHFENLYQLIQKLYVLLDFDELKSAYLHQLSDYVFDFDMNFGPDLNLFLDHFENDGNKISVQIPENKDAIKIMTAHKSKGLEFPVVMVPSLNWSILSSKNKFLVEDQSSDFVYYTSLSKDSPIKALKTVYEKEYKQALLDKINLNYVVFTRPQDRLYIRNAFSTSGKFGAEIHQLAQKLTEDSNEKIIYISGERSAKIQETKSENENSNFSPKQSKDNLWFPDISFQDSSLLSKNSISEERRFGNQLHEILSLNDNKTRLEENIQSHYLKGKIEQQFLDKIRTEAQKILQFPAYLELFEGAKEIIREQDIVLSENEQKRPDLIIVKENETLILDYKTGNEEAKHSKQIQTYCAILSKMGFPNVRGLIFYTTQLKVTNC